ncbi:FAD-binding oxidoreductase [Massilia antarctica]|uniref:FAD-binding oxidoreductase n=1 Tax=Massilia antarctica TaxID=2765360 RepID=UPI0006BB7804|nr:FAD-binding oxidoreductase [Massilia sp. H27-R4]MCY0912028.1 FAD-binding oxidoreductase [Massilia sp. H27-R4]CUI06507.1 4-cresol dehydrogenase [hydroxylating] flavoprotein subunit [Janthinobacterium sp. CG23_2]CUU30293.1 4-cresol dehydrogenase [hydroxylating] flavoprotein subunit [Janthinobacterium sp. CG23_2]
MAYTQSDHPSNNITGRATDVRGQVRPQSVRAVIKLVRAARQNGTPLYPFSTGLNFGYGGKSPTMAGSLLVDLGALNAIRMTVDKRNGRVLPVAVIGPGVTQGALYDFLEEHHPNLTFNVTGSARATSIIGNALDRGVGYFGPRKEDLFGLAVVCGNGKLLRTGFRRLKRSPLGTSNPYGLGPILDGLFFQSNFGIVVSACFRLVPKRPKQVALSLSLRREENLPAFIDELANCKREGLIESVTHIANRARTHATLAYGVTRYLEQECGYTPERAFGEAESVMDLIAPGEWASLGAITGTKAQVKANLAEIRKRMKGLARVRPITHQLLDTAYAVAHRLRFIPAARANAAAISAIRPLHTLALGVPTDAAIDNLLWKFGRADLSAAQLDQSNCGLLFINPALPLDGEFVARFIDEMKKTAARHYHDTLYITINIETPTSLVAVINLLFDRSNLEGVKRAHFCADRMLDKIHAMGLEVYRARADMMAAIVRRDPHYWATIHALKTRLDPDGIIAPGRYDAQPATPKPGPAP